MEMALHKMLCDKITGATESRWLINEGNVLPRSFAAIFGAVTAKATVVA